jgi:hypothetical protein
MPLDIDEGVSIATEPEIEWIRLPEKITRNLERAVGIDHRLLLDYRENALRMGGGRWRVVDAIGWVDNPVIVWALLTDTGLSPPERQVAWEDIQEWSGIQVSECERSPGGGWQAVTGDSLGTREYGLDAHHLRYYSDQGVAVLIVGSDAAEVQLVLDGLRVARPVRPVPPAQARPAATFAAMLAPEREVKNLAACPGPATREIQRLAASGRRLEVDVAFADGGSLYASVTGNRDPAWLLMFDDESPWTGTLTEYATDLRTRITGRALTDVSAKIRSPKATAEQEALAAERFAAALREFGAL